MDNKKIAIAGGIIGILVIALIFVIQKVLTEPSSDVAGATQSIAKSGDENFVPCPLSQGMLIGQQPLFIYQDTQTREQKQLQAVKVAAGIVSGGPVCQYYNNQSDIRFTLLLPGTFPETCKAVNTHHVGFSCEPKATK